MDYILSEKQLTNLVEISTIRGSVAITDDSFEKIFLELSEIRTQKVFSILRSYMKDVLGYVGKLEDKTLWSILDDLQDLDFKRLRPMELRGKDVLSNLSYHLAKNIWGLKKSGSLEILKFVDNYVTDYVFFDPESEMSIGVISVTDLEESMLNYTINLPSKSKKIASSQVDKEFKGHGYGKEMYFSLIEDLNLLASDVILYSDSLNIWVNVLPKKYFVYAITDEKIVKVLPNKKIPDLDSIKRFIALKNPNILKIKKY